MLKPFNWQTSDGLRLRAQYSVPDQSPQALIAIVHGLGEHLGRYSGVVQTLLKSGFAVFQFDLRGHGQSEGQRGYAPSYDVLLDDLEQFLQRSQVCCPNIPVFLYGHSFGGNLVLNYVLRRQPNVQGVIATGPSLRTVLKLPKWKVNLGRMMYHLIPHLSMSNEIIPEHLSHNPSLVQAYMDDPLTHNRITARLGIDLLDSGLWALEHAVDFKWPLLLMHGSSDQITDAKASQEFAEKAGSGCTLKLWEGLYHELHHEPEREQVLSFMLAWLVQRL